MRLPLPRFFIFLTPILLVLLSGCASTDLRGDYLDKSRPNEMPAKPSLTYVVFHDKVILKPSGLSAYRVGTPSSSFGDYEEKFGRIAAFIEKGAADGSIRTRLQSKTATAPITGASHVVAVSVRKVISGQIELEVVIHDVALKKPIWRGEITVTYNVGADEKAASEILRVTKEVVVAKTP